MDLSYQYQGKSHSVKIDWTENSYSVVFRNIGRELEIKHSFSLSEFNGQIKFLDDLADTLYKCESRVKSSGKKKANNR